MYLCRLFPARTLGVKANALNPLEAYSSVPSQQRQASSSKHSAMRPERSDWRHTGHPPRSSPNLELVAVTLRAGSQAFPWQPQHPQPGTAQLPLHPPLRVPSHQQSSAPHSCRAPARARWRGGARTLEATATPVRR